MSQAALIVEDEPHVILSLEPLAMMSARRDPVTKRFARREPVHEIRALLGEARG